MKQINNLIKNAAITTMIVNPFAVLTFGEKIEISQDNLSPLIVPAIMMNSTIVAEPLFQKINDTTLRLNNPQFATIYCVVGNTDNNTDSSVTIADFRNRNSNLIIWEKMPTDTIANSPLAWGKLVPSSNEFDWRTAGPFDFIFPPNKVFWIESRGPDLTIQNYVFDTRFPTPQMPTLLKAQDIGSQKVRFTWTDTSNNENAFHIIIQRLVGEKWVSIPFIRSNKDTTALRWQAQAGYYRFAIRSALSTTQESVTFNRTVPAALPDTGIRTVTFPIMPVVKYSQQSPWTFLLVNGTFPNPVAPTDFSVTINPNNSLLFNWKDNSNNESVFHIVEDRFVNNAWVRQPLIRIGSDKTTFTSSVKTSGRYRYCIRSAYSFPNTTVVRNSELSAWIEVVIP